jgi:uncharacterized Ntn-hydrolase superfamily protein
MTWSLLARDLGPDGSVRLGVAIASRFFAVGSLCVHTRAGVGVLATQALVNPLYGRHGLDLLQQGQDAAAVVQALGAADEGRAQRQVHLLPFMGAGAAHTGAACVDWCGHAVHADFSVAGNMLAGPQVLDATAQAFEASRGQPLAERLIAALCAGDAAGGDKRGRQSAAVRVQGAQDYPELDLRVDDHDQPFTELQRLHAKSLERFQPFVACLPTHERPAGELDRARIESRIAQFTAQRLNTSPRSTP